MTAVSPLVYLQKQIGQDFFTQWKTLTDADKDTMKRWAREEMLALGMEVMGG